MREPRIAAVPRVFITSTELSEQLLQRLFNTLPPARAALASRLARPESVIQSVLGFCLVRYALYALTGQIFSHDWQIGAHGKPCLPGGEACFNLSHTAHAVAAAVSFDEVGIDIEAVAPHHPRIASRICSPEELAVLQASPDPVLSLVRLWSAKEAEGKRLGTGLKNPESLAVDQVQITAFSASNVPHVLAITPAKAPLTVEWVEPGQLLLER